MNAMPAFATAFAPQTHHYVPQAPGGYDTHGHYTDEADKIAIAVAWDKEFQSLEQSLAAQTLSQQPDHVQQPSTQVGADDDLARTAALLIDAVKHEENPKFKNSQFMSLMRQLRDGEMTVEGNEMVATSDATRTGVATGSAAQSTLQTGISLVPGPSGLRALDIKGKGRATEPANGAETSFANYARDFLAQQEARESASEQREAEDANDAYFAQENADYMAYWDAMERAAQHRPGTTAQGTEWGRLQADWDRFEAAASGITRVANYQFQANNPYLLGEASNTNHHMMHGGGRNALLEVLPTAPPLRLMLTNAPSCRVYSSAKPLCSATHTTPRHGSRSA